MKIANSGDTSAAPTNQSVDVVRFVTSHRRRVSMLVEVRELGEHISMSYAIRTNNGRGAAFLENEGGTVFAGLTFKGEAVCQARIQAKVDQGADTVLFSVPRTCLGRPRWIRTGAVAITGDGTGLWLDDARRNAAPDQDDIKLGPRIAK